jgi:hypothetical protein
MLSTSTSRNTSDQFSLRSSAVTLKSRRSAPSNDELSSAENERVAEIENRILLVKQKRAPQAYETLRLKALNEVESDRLRKKSAPDHLEGVEPPWNDGRKEVHDLYDEMMVEDFEQRIAAIRFSSAGKRALEDAEKAEKAKGGPGGQDRR